MARVKGFRDMAEEKIAALETEIRVLRQLLKERGNADEQLRVGNGKLNQMIAIIKHRDTKIAILLNELNQSEAKERKGEQDG